MEATAAAEWLVDQTSTMKRTSWVGHPTPLTIAMTTTNGNTQQSTNVVLPAEDGCKCKAL